MTNMKLKVLAAAGVLILASCSAETSANKEKEESPEALMEQNEGQLLAKNDPRSIGGEKSKEQSLIEMAESKIQSSTSDLIGYWVGLFGKGTINLSISEINDTVVKGHTVCYGNFRPVTGTVTKNNEGTYDLNLKEPGDDKYDGEFNINIDPNSKELKGNWKPFKEKSTSEKEFTLAKKSYEFSSKNGQYAIASERLLTDEDLDNLVGDELEIMRNEIYARHGYSFRNEKMRSHFADQEWYIPMGVDIREKLTDIEAKNIQIIKRFESYFEEYYDEYGR